MPFCTKLIASFHNHVVFYSRSQNFYATLNCTIHTQVRYHILLLQYNFNVAKAYGVSNQMFHLDSQQQNGRTQLGTTSLS